MKRKAIALNSIDNIASALVDLSAGESVEVSIPQGKTRTLTLIQPVQLGHKFALAPIAFGADVIKLGMSIGVASQNIQVGEHVHVHNVCQTDDDEIVQNVES